MSSAPLKRDTSHVVVTDEIIHARVRLTCMLGLTPPLRGAAHKPVLWARWLNAGTVQPASTRPALV